MTVATFEGLYDTLRHDPFSLTIFHAMDLDFTLDFPGGSCDTVYFHDTRLPNDEDGQASQASQDRHGGSDARLDAISALRRQMLVPGRAKDALLVLDLWPEGGEGRRHVAGGGWHSGKGVVFYIARACVDGVWRKYLCANVYNA